MATRTATSNGSNSSFAFIMAHPPKCLVVRRQKGNRKKKNVEKEVKGLWADRARLYRDQQGPYYRFSPRVASTCMWVLERGGF